MGDLTERFKDIKPWASTPAERAAAVRERAKMEPIEGKEKKAAAVQGALKMGSTYP